jgi:ElaB/YqjD/DUF883 family membrane-anchored ribosome-binding protein
LENIMNDILNPPFAPEAANAAEDTVKRVAQGAHTMVDQAAEKGGPTIERLCSGVNNVAEAVQSTTKELSEIQERWVANTRGCVRDHPLLAIGVALGAGMIVRRLMER